MEFREAMDAFLNGELIIDVLHGETQAYEKLLRWLAEQGVYFNGLDGVVHAAAHQCIRYDIDAEVMFGADRQYYEEEDYEFQHIPIVELRSLYVDDGPEVAVLTDIEDML